MPDLLTLFLASTADFIRATLLLSIISFIAFIIIQPLYKKIRERLNWNWLKASFLASFIVLLIIISLAYFTPFLASEKPVFKETELMPTTLELIGFSLLQIIRILLVSAVLALILMPFALLAALVNDFLNARLKKKKIPASRKWINYFISILVSSSVALIIFLWLVPWAFSGLLYFIFFA